MDIITIDTSNEFKDELKKMLDSRHRICPDLDSDCEEITDHTHCFLGCHGLINGVIHNSGIAKGYCPFIHATN